MTAKVGVVRANPELAVALDELDELDDRCARLTLGESSTWANQTLAFARQVKDMIALARVVTRSALARDECRGAHYKPEFKLPMPEGRFPGDPEFEAIGPAGRPTTTAGSRPPSPSIRKRGPASAIRRWTPASIRPPSRGIIGRGGSGEWRGPRA
jgi:succinate dehydrogenase / fumarate reductase, flavoprotein subunit